MALHKDAGEMRKAGEGTGLISVTDRAFGAAQAFVELGITVTKACERAGLSRRTYYHLLKKKEGEGPDRPNAQCTKQAETTSNNRPAQHEGTSEARAS